MTTRTNPPGWVLVVALVLGVLGMHALVGPVALPDHGAVTVTAAHHAAPATTTDPVLDATACPVTGCDEPPAGHGTGHSVVSMCVAVLGATAVALLLVAALLRWGATPSPSPRSARTGPAAGRGPPPKDLSPVRRCVQRV